MGAAGRLGPGGRLPAAVPSKTARAPQTAQRTPFAAHRGRTARARPPPPYRRPPRPFCARGGRGRPPLGVVRVRSGREAVPVVDDLLLLGLLLVGKAALFGLPGGLGVWAGDFLCVRREGGGGARGAGGVGGECFAGAAPCRPGEEAGRGCSALPPERAAKTPPRRAGCAQKLTGHGHLRKQGEQRHEGEEEGGERAGHGGGEEAALQLRSGGGGGGCAGARSGGDVCVE